MKTWLVENKEKTVRVTGVEAETAEDAVAQVDGATQATDLAEMEKAYWAALTPKPTEVKAAIPIPDTATQSVPPPPASKK